ncbi:MAG: ATP-binding cassette domain-containing protein [Pseudomonadota bacterium]
MSSIAVRHLSKRFPDAPEPAVSGLSFTLPANECLSILGPSGCGKTTLLRILMGLEEPTDGSIEIPEALRGGMSYVFQEPRLVPWRTCVENVRLPLELTGTDSSQNCERVVPLLQQLGLANRLNHFPGELSGGMQMRVALARALITKPRVLLLDEPFAALDERTRFHMQDLLQGLKAELGLQYVFVTHSIVEAVYLGDRILLMDERGSARDWREVPFTDREHSLKQTAPFNELVSLYSSLFAEMESATLAKPSAGVQSQ